MGILYQQISSRHYQHVRNSITKNKLHLVFSRRLMKCEAWVLVNIYNNFPAHNIRTNGLFLSGEEKGEQTCVFIKKKVITNFHWEHNYEIYTKSLVMVHIRTSCQIRKGTHFANTLKVYMIFISLKCIFKVQVFNFPLFFQVWH
jgi:hypothetical protein